MRNKASIICWMDTELSGRSSRAISHKVSLRTTSYLRESRTAALTSCQSSATAVAVSAGVSPESYGGVSSSRVYSLNKRPLDQATFNKKCSRGARIASSLWIRI